MRLSAGTRYAVKVENEFGDSALLPFETAYPLCGKTITAGDEVASPRFFRQFTLPEGVKNGRLVISGLGLYRAFVNGRRVGKNI